MITEATVVPSMGQSKPTLLRNLSMVGRMSTLIVLSFSLALWCSLISIGFLIAPEVRRTTAEASLRCLVLGRATPVSSTDFPNYVDLPEPDKLKHLIAQSLAPLTLPERLTSLLLDLSEPSPTSFSILEQLVSLAVLVSPEESASRLAENIPALMDALPTGTSNRVLSELLPPMELLLDNISLRVTQIRESEKIEARLRDLTTECYQLRYKLAELLGLASPTLGRHIAHSVCSAYNSGPLRGLPTLSLLRSEPETPEALSRALRAAGSSIYFADGTFSDRATQQRFYTLSPSWRASLATLVPQIADQTERLLTHRDALERITQETARLGRKFIGALLNAMHEARVSPLHRRQSPVITQLTDWVVDTIACE
jgi:hypothetical protein